MENMLLKNPLNHKAEYGQDMAHAAAVLTQRTLAKLGCPTSERKKPPFTAQWGHCSQHGPYPLNTQDQRGLERWFPEGCIACLRQKNTERLLGASNIPRRFLECDFSNYEAITPQQQRVLQRCEEYAQEFKKFRSEGTCLLLCGRPGTGKNHLATAISRRLLTQGYSVLRVKAMEYLDAYWAKGFEARESWLKGMATVDLLIMDEVGKNGHSKTVQDAFFRLLDARYEMQLPSLLTTNLNREGLIEELGEATYDRLTQGGSVRLTLDWESRRATTTVSTRSPL